MGIVAGVFRRGLDLCCGLVEHLQGVPHVRVRIPLVYFVIFLVST